MRFAYADPPYLCGAHLYKADHPDWHVYATIDGHAALIERLRDEYPDGWALSMSSSDMGAMAVLMAVRAQLKARVHWGAWCKSFASFKPNVNPAYAWEPVAFYGGRKLGRDVDTVRDFIVCPITVEKGLTGAKPPKVCAWILDMLGFDAEQDTIDDLFPGTGIMGRVVEQRRAMNNNEPLRLIP